MRFKMVTSGSIINGLISLCCFLLLLIPFTICTATAHGIAPAPANCKRTCSGGPGIKPSAVDYPFGSSSGCPIQLPCDGNGNFLVGEFPVLSITADAITITIPAECGRPFSRIDHLFHPNFAPTSKNAILLNNCTQSSSCRLPSTMVDTHFESVCGGGNATTTNTTMSCYSEDLMYNSSGFINLSRLRALKCQYLLSSISAEESNGGSVALDVQMIQLGWWLKGDCNCADNADCTNVVAPPSGNKGYRCHCRDGFVGDGFSTGSGCRRDISTCNPAKYLSGRCGGKTRIIVLAGGVVAGACLMIGIGLILCFIRRSYRIRCLVSKRHRLCEATSACTIPVYPYKEIERATNHFADKQRLGTGAYGTVYAGKLHGDDQYVAIKRIKHTRDTDTIQQVVNEIRLLSSVSHPNLVRLLGCSIDQGEQVLIYEFMPNGTLSQHLLQERGHGLPWAVRLAIATETAQAIAHLHSADPPIYHRDVKSSNILLDYDFKCKVADFGLSRLGRPDSNISHISTAPQGTPGYLDPQYHQNFHLSDKSDVYSFGVVLAEIITSLKVVDFNRNPNEINLAALATDRIGQGRLFEIVDPLLEPNKDEWTQSSIRKVAELAFRCLAFHRDSRPSMAEVADEMEGIRLSSWSKSEEDIIISNERTTASVSEVLLSYASSSSSPSSSSSMREKLLSGSEKTSEEETTDLQQLQVMMVCDDDEMMTRPTTLTSPASPHPAASNEDNPRPGLQYQLAPPPPPPPPPCVQ